MDQRRTFTQDRPGIGELDQLYKNANALDKPVNVQSNYTITVNDKRISLTQPGLTVTLPTLNSSADGYRVFVQDRSGLTSTAASKILVNTGKTIKTNTGTVSVLWFLTDFSFFEVQWDVARDAWFLVG